MPRPARTMSANLAGIVTFAASLFLISTSDMLAKRLTGEIHPVQVVWMRQSGLVLVALALLATRGAGLLRAAAPGLQLMRGFAATLSALAFIAALRFVPLADAVAVSFVAPFMVAVLGAVFLRETVSGPRWPWKARTANRPSGCRAIWLASSSTLSVICGPLSRIACRGSIQTSCLSVARTPTTHRTSGPASFRLRRKAP